MFAIRYTSYTTYIHCKKCGNLAQHTSFMENGYEKFRCHKCGNVTHYKTDY